MADRVFPEGDRDGATPIIFIVDDDDAVREALQLLVDLKGWESRGYASASAFLDDNPRTADSQWGCTCLVLDLAMRDMNGAELLEHLGRSPPAPPTIVVTAHDAHPLADRALDAGALAIVPKPFRNEHLLALLQTALFGSR